MKKEDKHIEISERMSTLTAERKPDWSESYL